MANKNGAKARTGTAVPVKDNVVPFNVMNNNDSTPIKAFTEEGDVFAGKTREELLEELGKSGATVEETTGVVVEDAITGEKIPGVAKDLPTATSLQELEPENIKRYLSNIVKTSLMALIPGDLTGEEADEIIDSIEKKIIDIDKKVIKNMTAEEVRDIYGIEVFNQIKKFNPKDYNKLAKKLLVDFKDGIVEFQDVIDASEEINRHIKFFQDINVDEAQQEIRNQIENDNETYPTEFHKYKKYLELYLEYLNKQDRYQDNPFMDKEKEVTLQKIKAIEETMDFRHIYHKCENGKQKLLKDFKTTQVLNKAIFDFVGKLSNDNTMNVAFPIPKNFNVKANATEILTSIWISFLEMAIMRGNFDNIKNLTPAEYIEMTQVLRGQEPVRRNKSNKEEEQVESENKIDIKEFIKENKITLADITESRKAAIAISYIIARTFKPTVINGSNHMKYVLSYTMKLLSQGLYNDACNKILLELVEGIKVRLAK